MEMETNTPQQIKDENSFPDFPNPTRLQKNKRPAQTQYSEKSSTREEYTKWLLNGCDSSIPVVTKYAKFPIKAVSYKATVTNQTKCEVCVRGFFKPDMSISSAVSNFCIAHTKCPPGEYTQAAGSATAQPQCEPCAAGFFKDCSSKFIVCRGARASL